MRLEFEAKTNKPYCMVNTADFLVYNEDVVTFDRERTEYTIKDGRLDMLWRNVYIWKINGRPVSEDGYEGEIPNDKLYDMFQNAVFLGFELEEDANEDYTLTDVNWCYS